MPAAPLIPPFLGLSVLGPLLLKLDPCCSVSVQYSTPRTEVQGFKRSVYFAISIENVVGLVAPLVILETLPVLYG
jgi:hypothetical protein